MVKTVIIGLGNTVLTDDGAGVYTARILRERLGSEVEILEAETAGMDLMEMLAGHKRAIIIDAIMLDDVQPGTVFRLSPDDLRITPRLASCHDIDVVTALELGRRLGFSMPEEVIIYAIQGEDMLTLNEGCLETVAKVLPMVADEIASLVHGRNTERLSIDLADRSRGNA